MEIDTYNPGVPTFGENLRRCREAAGLSRRELAKRLGLAEGSSYLGDLETNRYDNVGLFRAMEIAVILRISLNELVGGIHEAYDALTDERRRIESAHLSPKEHPRAPVVASRLLEQERQANLHLRATLQKAAADIVTSLTEDESRRKTSRPTAQQAGRGARARGARGRSH